MSNDFCPRCGLDIEKGRCSNCGYNAKTGQMEQRKLTVFKEKNEPVQKQKPAKSPRIKTEAGQLNPFFSIFINMRKSMRYIIDSGAYGGWTIFGMVFLNGFFGSFFQLQKVKELPFLSINPENFLPTFLIFSAVSNFIGTAFAIWIAPRILNMIFGLVGGNGSLRATKLAFGWSCYPSLIFGLAFLPFNLQWFLGQSPLSGDLATMATASMMICTVSIFFTCYNILYSIKLYAEAQQISFWRSLIGLIIAILIPVALGICGVIAAGLLATTAG